MTEYQAEVIIHKLREAESLVLSMYGDDQEHCDELHDAKIHIWKAIDKIGEATNER